MSKRSLLKVEPKAFALDEKLNLSFSILESKKDKIPFSLLLGDISELELFIKKDFARYGSGFSLAQTIMEKFDYKVAKAVISSKEERVQTFLYLKNKESAKLEKLAVTPLELMGLWHLKDFSLFASKEFIESARDVKIPAEGESFVDYGPFDKYGQKYLM